MPTSRPSSSAGARRRPSRGAPRAARGPATRTRARARTGGPTPTLVLLVRHGRTTTTGKELPGRAPGLHLSDVGRAQAEAAASRIAELDPAPSAVYASPLERAKETAAPIARALGVRVRTAPDLVELDVGEWTGQRLARLVRRPQWAAVHRWPAGFGFPEGESFVAMQARAQGAVLALVAEHPGETIVAVSHADPIKAIVSAAAGAPLDLFQRVVVSPASISAVLYTQGGPHVLCVNTLPSLAELALS